MAKKYFITTASHLVPVQGIMAGGVSLYEMEDSQFKELCDKQNPASFHVLTKEEYEAQKKMVSLSGLPTESAQTQPLHAQPAEEDKTAEEEDVLKVSKVKAPEAPNQKKGKS